MPHHSTDNSTDNLIIASVNNANKSITSIGPSSSSLLSSITTGCTYCEICGNTIYVDEGSRISYICEECKTDINELKFMIKNKKKLPREWNCNVRRINHR